jgi:DNA polymerase I-like protein with 3'-5' exonuclease and polymerase domains
MLTEQQQSATAWQLWDGQQLGKHFALDTETGLIDGHRVPRLALASVADDTATYIVHPEQLGLFLCQHLPAGQMACHNLAFDFWVLDAELRRQGCQEALQQLWAAADQQRLHCTMLLATLIGIATYDDDKQPSLAALADQVLGLKLDKDTYRLRYAELIGNSWEQVDPGFFTYAATDAYATYRIYCWLTHRAEQIAEAAGAPRQYGWLTEGIQVRAAICLDAIHRAGLRIDTDRAAQLQADVSHQIEQTIYELQQLEPELFHRYKRQPNLFKVNADTGLPRLNQAILATKLQTIAAEHQLQLPSTDTGRLSLSVNECWNEHRGLEPFVDAYCTYKELTKLRTFFNALNQPVIRPRYRVLVRTGRTSCSSPNIQQLPRDSHIREAVVPRPGYLFLIIDYAALELRTLAAVCQHRYGFSRLADVIRAGTDPHSYTAAMFAGVGLEQFQQLPNRKQLRQQAKAVNFGLPGGLGAAALANYAKHTYGVQMTVAQAAKFRTMLTEQVYPELKLYLGTTYTEPQDTVCTLTGRVRKGVTYTMARNTPFSGLAADGAKLAMWQLLLAGYRIVAFVHDEFIIELPAEADHTAQAKQVERICCQAMQQLVGDIPIECEYGLADRWYKQATAVWDAEGRLIPWQPDSR